MKKLIVFLLALAPLLGKDRRPSDPYLTGDTFRSQCDWIFDETNQSIPGAKVKEGDLIFVKTDLLEFFFKRAHPYISVGYVLITHNSDVPCPGKYSAYLDDPKILAWFGQNVEYQAHPKLHPIPIGLENRYGKYGNPKWIETQIEKKGNKKHLLYANFSAKTNRSSRGQLLQRFKNEPYCKIAQNLEYKDYLRDLAASYFVLSPSGNGYDCHRTWEALYLGAIPIVKSSSMDPLFADLPVLIVHDWNEITESFLKNTWEEMQKKTYNLDKLFISFWIAQFHSLGEET